MKTLCLMRHAEAEKGPDDHTRPLTRRGVLQAQKAALWLQNAGVFPEIILSSDSRRTRETAELIAGTVELTRDLYLAESDIILSFAEKFLPQHQVVMIVAHNPGIFEAAVILGGNKAEQLMGMPPATIAIYRDGILAAVYIAD